MPPRKKRLLCGRKNEMRLRQVLIPVDFLRQIACPAGKKENSRALPELLEHPKSMKSAGDGHLAGDDGHMDIFFISTFTIFF